METKPNNILLPVSGFVLAGGKSSRMGVDKAGLMFRGRPLVELAVEKLSRFCADVAIAGNRTDLAHVAPVVTETRVGVGPGAGIEAGLRASRHDWCMFLPVDVPLLPFELLRDWAAEVLADEPKGLRGSYLTANGQRQPSICLLHRSCLERITKELDRGERKLAFLFRELEAEFGVGAVTVPDAAGFVSGSTREDLEWWFSNLNTPEEFVAAENFRSADEE